MITVIKKKSFFRRCAAAFWMSVFLLAAGGCGMVRDNTEKLGDLDYTVVSPDEFPAKLSDTIESKKEKPFRITYSDRGYLYICVGYGAQPTGGYSISVEELYETANGIYIDTTLIGPHVGEDISKAASYPYIVIKIEDLGKSVIFN